MSQSLSLKKTSRQSVRFSARPLASAVRAAVMSSLLFSAAGVRAELPVAMGGLNSISWTSSGSIASLPTPNELVIDQSADFAVYNWQSFNVSAGNTVTFNQPAVTSAAYNLIQQGSPSQIFGAIHSNGQVYLINANGFVFGEGVQINVASLVASSLNVAISDVQAGLESAAAQGRPAFSAFAGANGNIEVKPGASITVADGGKVLLFAANVTNEGSIVAPDGQVVMAAGNKVYLTKPDDANLNGFLVEVDADEVSDTSLNDYLAGKTTSLSSGTVSNKGSIEAKGGNASLVGLAVNQSGRVNVSKAVNDGGSIRLVARDRVSVNPASATPTMSAARRGKVSITANSTGSSALNAGQSADTNEVAGRVDITANNAGSRIAIHAGRNAPAESTDTATDIFISGEKVEIAGTDVLINAPNIDFNTGSATASQPSVDVQGTSVVVSTLQFQAANVDRKTYLRPTNEPTATPSFAAYTGGSGDLTISAGTHLGATANGRVMVFGKNVENRGSITTGSDSQIILAAGDAVYVARPTDIDLRGYIVDVANDNVSDADIAELLTRPENGSFRLNSSRVANFGTLSALEGNVMMVGLDIVQGGTLITTTSINLNGSVSLWARDVGRSTDDPTTQANEAPSLARVSQDEDNYLFIEKTEENTVPERLFRVKSARNGLVTLGAGTVTEVGLSASADTVIDLQTQRPSEVRITGKVIRAYANSRIAAQGGEITLLATAAPLAAVNSGINQDPAQDVQIYLADGVVIDASGADATVAASQYLVQQQLVSEQLNDTPVQRDGVLFGEKVWVDLRQSGTDDTGRTWFGTPLANLAGLVNAQQRDVRERNATGGTIRLISRGQLLVEDGATLDVSGGAVNYLSSAQSTSRVIKDGRVFDIADGDPLISYDLVFDPNDPPNFEQLFHERWGIANSYGPSLLTMNFGRNTGTQAYVEGRDAGAVELDGAYQLFAGRIQALTTRSANQRKASDITIDRAQGRSLILGSTTHNGQVRPTEVAAAEEFDRIVNNAIGRRPSDQLPLVARLSLGVATSLINAAGTVVDEAGLGNDVVLLSALSGTQLLSELGLNSSASERATLPETLSASRLAELVGKRIDVADLFEGADDYAIIASGSIGEGAAGHVSLEADSQVILASDANLSNGSLSVISERTDFVGDIHGAGASIKVSNRPSLSNGTFARAQIVVHGGATLDVSGRWVNDVADRLNGITTPAPMLVNAGSIVFNAGAVAPKENQSAIPFEVGGLVSIQSGAALLAEGGAFSDSDINLSYGKGGDISLVAERGNAVTPYAPGQRPLTLAGRVSGLSFGEAGTLTLGAPSLCLGAACDSSAALNALAANDANLAPVIGRLLSGPSGDPLQQTLSITDPSALAELGFGTLAFKATGGALLLAPGTRFAPVARNRILNPGVDGLTSGDVLNLVGTASGVVLPDAERGPVNVALDVKQVIANVRPDVEARVQSDALVLARGSRIDLEALGSVKLEADSRIEIEGAISAPAGTITAKLKLANSDFNVLNQTIWLSEAAQLSVAGVAEFRPDITDLFIDTALLPSRRFGEVLDAGTISLDADAGYLVTESGSTVDASGVAESIGILDARGQRQSVLVAGRAGNITLEGAEGVLLYGDIKAQAANAPGTIGGALKVSLDSRDRGFDLPATGAVSDGISSSSRVLNVSAAQPSPDKLEGNTAGLSFSESTLGQGYVSANTIAAGGFARVALAANPTEVVSGVSNGEATGGRIHLVDSLTLGAQASLTLTAQQIRGNGGDVLLQAPLVQLVGTGVSSPTKGTGTFTVAADLLTLQGQLSIDQFATVALRSRGEIRTVGALGSQLVSGADLLLVAERITPATLSDYTFSVDTDGGRIRTENSSDALAGLPLSVGGTIKLSADQIEHAGSIVAPLGSITLDADEQLTTFAGSRLSVSPAGLSVPFGRTEFQLKTGWVYPEGSNQRVFDAETIVTAFSNDPLRFPEGVINLAAPAVNLDGGTVDISAVAVAGTVAQLPAAPTYTDPTTGQTLVGGQVFAFEWFSGNGGSRDILEAGVIDGSFAVLPGLNSLYAPYDTAISSPSTLGINETVTLAGGAGLAAGTYVKLPARYALVPGAFLVRELAGSQDYAGIVQTRPDGAAITSGYTGITGSNYRDSRTHAYEVASRATLDERAEYRIADANTYFVGASNPDLAATHKPIDANRLSIQARDSLRLDAVLAANSAPGGAGSVVDISRITGGANNNITITNDVSSAPADDLALSDQSISKLGADSLLIGGTREITGTEVSIEVTTQNLTLADGVVLTGRDIILAAKGDLTLKGNRLVPGPEGTVEIPGAQIIAEGGSPDARSYTTSGRGALIRASGAVTEAVVRTTIAGESAVTNPGNLKLEPGSRIDVRVGEGTVGIVPAKTALLLPDGTTFDIPTLLVVRPTDTTISVNSLPNPLDFFEGTRLRSPPKGTELLVSRPDFTTVVIRPDGSVAPGEPLQAQTKLLFTRPDGITELVNRELVQLPGGALQLDASGDSVFAANSFRIKTEVLNIGASSISLGETEGRTLAGLSLSNDALAALTIGRIALLSRSAIDFYGNTLLKGGDITLDTAELRGFDNTDKVARIEGVGDNSRLVIRNTASTRSFQFLPGSGKLEVAAVDVTFGPGNLNVDGFSAGTTITASREFRFGTDSKTVRTSSYLKLGSGDFNVQAARLSADAGATAKLSVLDGAVNFGNGGFALPGDLAASGLGARVAVTARDAITLSGAQVDMASGTLELTSNTSDVRITGNSNVDLGGRATLFSDKLVASPGGVAVLDSKTGDVAIDTGSVIDVSAPEALGHAGRIELYASQGEVSVAGELRGTAGALAGSEGGSLIIDTQQSGNSARYIDVARNGGFTQNFGLRLRQGDLTLDGTFKVYQLAIALDGQGAGDDGNFVLNGVIDATGERGGKVTIDAKHSLTMNAGSLIDARATSASGRGGKVKLGLVDEAGSLRFKTGAAIDVTAGSATEVKDSGEIHLRVHRDVVNTADDGAARRIEADGEFRGSGWTQLEAYKAYDAASLSGVNTATAGLTRITALPSLTALNTESNDFMIGQGVHLGLGASVLKNALGRGSDTSFDILPGVELTSAGSISLEVDWSLHDWRYDDGNAANGTQSLPGVLTIRAANNLDIGNWENNQTTNNNGTAGGVAGRLSDGFGPSTSTGSDAARNNGAPVYVDVDNSSVVDRELVSTGFGTVGDSWSFNLAAGADLKGANVLAVVRDIHLSDLPSSDNDIGTLRVLGGTVELADVPGAGNVPLPSGVNNNNPTLAPPITRAIRTGTGDLNIATAGDVKLGNAAAVIYTAGKRYGSPEAKLLTNNGATGTANTTNAASNPRTQNARLGGRAYPDAGGDLAISAGGSIIGAQARTGVSEWLYRTGGEKNGTGSTESATLDGPVGWTVAFDRFENGVGALGGGDVTLTAGQDIEDLQVALPSIGAQVGSATSFAGSRVVVLGGGDLNARAGGDVLGGVFYVGKGAGVVSAGNSITSDSHLYATASAVVNGRPTTGGILNTIAVVDDGYIDFQARTGVILEAVANSTMLPFSASQTRYSINFTAAAAFDTYFSTYTENAGVGLTSLAGDLQIKTDTKVDAGGVRSVLDAEYDRVNSSGSSGSFVTLPLPPTLSMRALAGDVVLADTTLIHSSSGTVEILAAGNVITDAAGKLTQPVGRFTNMPAVFNPDRGTQVTPEITFTDLAEFSDTAPNAEVARAGDTIPNYIVALNGQLGSEPGKRFEYDLAKQTNVYSGGDINNLFITIQHNNGTDVSRIVTGGDLRYDLVRDFAGSIQVNAIGGITVDGPGRLELVTGGDIDLGNLDGIVTRGDREKSGLVDGGADIYLLAGIQGQQPEYRNFLNWLANSYPVLRSRSLIVVDPDSRRPITIPDGANFGLIDRVEASEGETGDLATLVVLNAVGDAIQSQQRVRVIADAVDISDLFPATRTVDLRSERLLDRNQLTDQEALVPISQSVVENLQVQAAASNEAFPQSLLAPSTQSMFALLSDLGAAQTPLENAIRQGINGLVIDSGGAATIQHPTALVYEAVAQLFPRSGDRNLLLPLNEFALGVTTLDDLNVLGEKLTLGGSNGGFTELQRAITGEYKPTRKPSLADVAISEASSVSESERRAEAQATALVNEVRKAGTLATVDRLLKSAALDGSVIGLTGPLIFPNAANVTDAAKVIDPGTYVDALVKVALAELEQNNIGALERLAEEFKLGSVENLVREALTQGRAALPEGIELAGEVSSPDAIVLPLRASFADDLDYDGTININFSRVNTEDGGDIFALSPGGSLEIGGVRVVSAQVPNPNFINDEQTPGVPQLVEAFKDPQKLGLVTRTGGSINFLAAGPTNVNLSRIFATPNDRNTRSESILGVSTTDDIDAGRGSRTAISTPVATFQADAFGKPEFDLGIALTGSGIRSFDPRALDVFITPVGVLDTNEAGVFSEGEVVPPPNVTGIAGISAGGGSSGGGGAIAAPAAPDVVSNVAKSVTDKAQQTAQDRVAENSTQESAPVLGILKVEVLSFFGPGAEEAEESP